jgi:hypothetical protein
VSIDTLNARDDFRELAERYETVAALDVHPSPPVGRATPGSRLPPGMQEVLDRDEVRTALTAVDDWAEFLVHVLADEREMTAPDSTPARLRLIGEQAAHFLEHEDELLALSVADDLHDHLRTLRRLAGRAVRRVQTGVRCQHPACEGRLVSPLGTTDDRHDAALVCDKDSRHTVPHSVWSSWPRARVQYVTVEHAARMLGTSVAAVKMRASRGRWRKIGTGRDVRYSVDDVREASGMVAL